MVSILRRAIALMLVVLALGLSSCGGDRDVPVVLLAEDETQQTANPLIGAIAEVSPPERIQQLKPYLDVYEPQVRIARPDPDETITNATVQVELQVRDFPIYKDQSLGFGPHLHLFVDDQLHQAIYDADAPITLENLSPGTHTLRLLAVRPWGESFKNEGAYDQVTFNVFAASAQNNPDDSQPVLTYNQPQDRYGAEPILLDFHLHNAPPHLVAQADATVVDWRIRCTVNGESFVFDRWQPIYLKGFKPGKNWLKLELIDETGNLIDNALNSSIRVIDYQPGGEDGLSKLVRGEISLAQAQVLIDPNYEPPVLTVEEPAESAAEDETEAVQKPTAEPEAETEAVEAPATKSTPETPSTPQELEPESSPATESVPEPVVEPHCPQRPLSRASRHQQTLRMKALPLSKRGDRPKLTQQSPPLSPLLPSRPRRTGKTRSRQHLPPLKRPHQRHPLPRTGPLLLQLAHQRHLPRAIAQVHNLSLQTTNRCYRR